MKARQGYTLVEVVVAVLISLIMISAVFSVALTSTRGGAKEDRRLVAAQAAQSMLKRLANYVCSDPNNTLIGGPSNPTSPGLASWSFNGFQGCTDNLGTVYALAPGQHIINCPAGILLPATVSANTTVSYQVSWAAGCYTLPTPIAANCGPAVQVAVYWTE